MKYQTFLKGFGGAVLAAGIALPSVSAQAEDLNLISATSHPTVLPWVGAMKDFVVPEIDKRFAAAGLDIKINWNEQYGTGLFPPTEALESAGNGLVHLTWVGTLFEPAKMSIVNVAFSAPFATDDPIEQLGVVNGLYDKFPEMGAAWEKQGNVFLGAQATASYEILTTFPLEKLSDLDGRKILAPGPIAQWLKNTGAVPVDGNLPGASNMLQTGVVDGVIIPITNAFGFKLHDVAKFVTLVNFGSQTTGGLSMNKDTFDALPPAAQKIVLEVGREFSTVHGKAIQKRSQGALAQMRSSGATVSELPQAEKQKWLDALPPLGAEWVSRNAANGPAADILASYMAGIRAAGKQPLRAWELDK